MSSRVVYKYKLDTVDIQQIYLPYGANILKIDMQGPDLVLWAMIDADDTAATVMWQIRIAGTGHVMGSAWTRDRYICSYYTGTLVFHTFARVI